MTYCLTYDKLSMDERDKPPAPPSILAPGTARVRQGFRQLVEPLLKPDHERRPDFNGKLDRIIAKASALAPLMLCHYFGEAEFHWPDPMTVWPYSAEAQLKYDDQFLIRFPAIRQAKDRATVGDKLDEPNPEPRRRGGEPWPERDWIPVPMEQWAEPSFSQISLGDRVWAENDYFPFAIMLKNKATGRSDLPPHHTTRLQMGEGAGDTVATV